ncbi:hypothetical protein T4A_13847 [Trichinella pseudospiralis]|uniref:Uncharacterized protein n=1 Tax=Trichinella pseudospiralis TaxID=6337 RepID=A0A0V1EW68_TRIPS|nr:hypothetical protein T4E_8072 [Trichinella pseudospiralis]KRY77982.1 hypothetical protein T4A_13847 [Trichinella pseudospiralis]KRY91492.1 hypothetical protein T4D_5233 [Trichinella pseudospiralis]
MLDESGTTPTIIKKSNKRSNAEAAVVDRSSFDHVNSARSIDEHFNTEDEKNLPVPVITGLGLLRKRLLCADDHPNKLQEKLSKTATNVKDSNNVLQEDREESQAFDSVNSSSGSLGKRRSALWFPEGCMLWIEKKNVVKCLHCGVVKPRYKSSPTTSLWRHVKQMHPVLYQQLKEASKANSENLENISSGSLTKEETTVAFENSANDPSTEEENTEQKLDNIFKESALNLADQFSDELKKVGSQSYVDDVSSRIAGKQQTFSSDAVELLALPTSTMKNSNRICGLDLDQKNAIQSALLSACSILHSLKDDEQFDDYLKIVQLIKSIDTALVQNLVNISKRKSSE